MLKNSARNCREARSRHSDARLPNDISKSAKPGPRNIVRGASPYVPRAGSEKTAGLNHIAIVSGVDTGPETFGRCPPSPLPARSDGIVIDNGRPDSKLLMPESCQP